MPKLELTTDDLLTTTRAVRKRLDLTRPVDPDEIRECLEIALQAPTGSNRQNWHFVVVTDRDQIAALADLYRRGGPMYREVAAGSLTRIDPTQPDTYEAVNERVQTSSSYLFDHIHEVPGVLVPCIAGRAEGLPIALSSSMLGSVIQATWSFMLAARNRGIGTVWTTVHLMLEEESAAILGIPYDEVTQVAMIPFGYSLGTEFRPATREPLDAVLHWDRW